MAVLVRPADWQKEQESIRAIREAVFVQEQKVPADLEWDNLEESSQHFLVFNEGVAVGTGRLGKNGKIGRMAIKQSARGLGLGAQLLNCICDYAKQRGLFNIYLHAQQHAQGFYTRGGFIAEGEIFYEAGIPHIKMVRQLN
ncbi:GNAT family N-acetyltransferase [Microbulbifer sp. THAF38]|uniref:GNAT family N-acetyltransferase n=1 Tax=Microbulbifer sp. THAF38 TaxID=2587856 RepID=UPI0012693601|nr:GNAT family N-acetyltransferase [Microbulbifer sp. THAF38]QFT54739.1 putative N-acetyltransferase YjcF [Microbulbifer sp. THAF38]